MSTTRLSLSLSTEELALIDQTAEAQGISRAQVLRARAFASRNYTPTDYERLISKANRVADLPRSQVERIVNAVFIELMGPCVREAS
jgi:hypothetical protein